MLPLCTSVMLRRLLLHGVTDGRPDQAFRAFDGDRFDADAGGVGEADALDPHLLPQELDDLLRLGRARFPFDAGIDVLGVLAEDHHINQLRPQHGRRHSLEIAHRAETHVEVQHLAQGYVEAAEALAHGRGQRALDGHQVLPDDIHRLLRQQAGRTIVAVDRLGLLPRIDLRPGDLLLAAVRLGDGAVQHRHRSSPDVHPGPVTFDERDDGVCPEPAACRRKE